MSPTCYLDEYVVVLHQQRVVVDLAKELGRHHFVRAVLDEACDVEKTWREAGKTTGMKKTKSGTGDLKMRWTENF